MILCTSPVGKGRTDDDRMTNSILADLGMIWATPQLQPRVAVGRCLLDAFSFLSSLLFNGNSELVARVDRKQLPLSSLLQSFVSTLAPSAASSF